MAIIQRTSLLRPASLKRAHKPAACLLAHRSYATAKPPPHKHRQVTTFNDDGRVRWGDLSIREKGARSTQQSFNFLVIIAGVLMTGAVAQLLYKEVFAVDSKTSHFNRTVTRIKNDAHSVDILAGGDAKKIKAYGEPTWNRWSRNRAIASKTEKDGVGVRHMRMHFNVEGPKAHGVVQLHMIQRNGEWEYKLLALDVPGHQRIYLENADAAKLDTRKDGKMFGVKWW